MQRASQRAQLALTAFDPSFKRFLRDVQQAYVQSKTKMNRPIYARPPLFFGMPKELLLCIEKLLYGLPESCTYWFYIYQKYHCTDLKVIPSMYDPCFRYTKNCLSTAFSLKNVNQLKRIVCFQTDDTSYSGNDAFFNFEVKNARILIQSMLKFFYQNQS